MDFFVSYTRADRAWAEWIAWHLEERGYSVVIQAWDFRPGGNFALAMQRAAVDAERTIAVLSPDYLVSEFAAPEWAAAFARDPAGTKGVLVPVRIRECHPAGVFAQVVYVDLVGIAGPDDAKEVLLAGVERGRAKPTSTPAFPGLAANAPRAAANEPRFPGALPPIWNVPSRRNPNFTGREALLERIHTVLNSGAPIALTGMGGVGKTHLAVEYIYRHSVDYDVVWWLRAEQAATLVGDFADLAREPGIVRGDASDPRAQTEGVRRWLRAHPRWLLVFDNATSAVQLYDYLAQSGGGHILVTSRDADWSEVATVVSVDELPTAEAVDFLLKRTRQTDGSSAAKLAHELGELPLALEHAGAYIARLHISFDEYLQLFRTRQREIMRRDKPPLGYHATVATTWLTSFEQLQKTAPDAVALLSLGAFLAAEAIPRSLLRDGAQNLPAPLDRICADDLALDDALNALRTFSLVTLTGSSWAMHRLVQAVIRDWLPEEQQKRWAAAAVSLLRAAFPPGNIDPLTARSYAPLLAHAVTVGKRAERLGVAAGDAVYLLVQGANYLYQLGRLAEARTSLEEALRIAEVSGSSPAVIGSILSNLGVVLDDLNDLVAAKTCLERALGIDEVIWGADSPTVAIRLNNLGSVLQNLGDLEAARRCYERALEIDETALGPKDPNVALRHNNLGDLLRQEGRLVEAREHLERALAINEAALGVDHPSVATNLQSLGNVLHMQRDLAGAQACFERALRIDENVFGADHLTVGHHVSSLGGVYFALGERALARAFGERALAIYVRVLGEPHPETLRMRQSLALLDR